MKSAATWKMICDAIYMYQTTYQPTKSIARKELDRFLSDLQLSNVIKGYSVYPGPFNHGELDIMSGPKPGVFARPCE